MRNGSGLDFAGIDDPVRARRNARLGRQKINKFALAFALACVAVPVGLTIGLIVDEQATRTLVEWFFGD